MPPGHAPPAAAWVPLAAALALVVLAALAHGPALDNGFVWDDDDYVTENPTLRSAEGLRRIWLEPGAVPQYYPLTFTTLWAEFQLAGLAPRVYHRTNVALHAAGAVLAWVALRRLAVPGAWIAAALFAVHPVHVESVAWVAERKNVLSGALALGALAAWLAMPPGGSRRRGWYAAALVLYGGALLSKTVTATLPAVLLVLGWWRRGRIDRDDVPALAPFFALGAAAACVTVWMEATHVGARGVHFDHSPLDRVLIAGRAVWFYVRTLAWPSPLVFIYPRWSIDPALWWQWLFPLAALAAAGGLWAGRGRFGLGPLVAAVVFVLTLAPALGFVDVYPMRYSFVADHFQYLASLAPFALAGALAARGGKAGGAVAGVVLAVLVWQARERALAFRDAETLWRDTLAKNPDAGMARVNLGLLLHRQGRDAEAVRELETALVSAPDDPDVLNNLGLALAAQGRLPEAMARWEAGVRADPRHAVTRNNLGNALAEAGRLEEARAQFLAAIEADPGYAEAHSNLGTVLALGGDPAGARARYEAALALDPAYTDAHRNLAVVLAADGRFEEAIVHWQAALRHGPRTAALHGGLAAALAALGRGEEAEAEYRAALRLDPGYEPARQALGGDAPG